MLSCNKNNTLSGDPLSYLNDSIKPEGEKILNTYRASNIDGYSLMLPAIPNLSKYIDLMQRDKADMTDAEKEMQKLQRDYEAEVIVFRALENLKEDCLVLHGMKNYHHMWEAIKPGHNCTSSKSECKNKGPHLCRDCPDKSGIPYKSGSHVDGETDFLVMGKQFFATFEVKNPGGKPRRLKKNYSDLLKSGITQTEKTEALLKRVMELVLGSSSAMPILKFCVFPLLEKEKVQTKLTGKPEDLVKNLLFQDDFKNFQKWWDENIENSPKLQGVLPISINQHHDLKWIIAGLGSKTHNFDYRESIRETDKNLRESKVTRKVDKTIKDYNTEIIECTLEIKKNLGINYLRKSQIDALNYQSDHLVINGPAGTGKTIILQALSLKIVKEQAVGVPLVICAFGYKAAAAYEKIMNNAGIRFHSQNINKNMSEQSPEKIEKSIEQSECKVAILSIAIVDFSVSILGFLIEIVKRFKYSCVMIDDIQCILTPKSLPKFEELIECISKCKYVRMSIDAVQLFHHPKSEDEMRALNQALERIGKYMKVMNLQSNMRNSYEIASLLEVVREEFIKTIEGPKTMFPSQMFAHYIHGLRTVIHVIKSKKLSELNTEVNKLLKKEKKHFSQTRGKDDLFQILWMKGSKKVTNNRYKSHTIKLADDLTENVDKIRYSYSREWPAVVGLIAIDNKTNYREFLSWVYIAVSRARVYSSLILYIGKTGRPKFLKGFLESVQRSPACSESVQSLSTATIVLDHADELKRKPGTSRDTRDITKRVKRIEIGTSRDTRAMTYRRVKRIKLDDKAERTETETEEGEMMETD